MVLNYVKINSKHERDEKEHKMQNANRAGKLKRG
jgi:hypothetical protein